MNSLVSRTGQSSQALFSGASSRLAIAHGRSSAYRRISQLSITTRAGAQEQSHIQSYHLARLRSPFTPESLYVSARVAVQSRQFHATSVRGNKEKPAEEKPSETKTEEEPAKDKESESKSEEGENQEQKKQQKTKKEDLPPPPPHGNKTPWEVFKETFQSEMEQSKEWNESTKAIASSAHQFTESESVRRAREAYEKTSSAVSTTTSKVVKTTAGAIGKGATWTWETPVVKGVRSAANVTGEALDKATKPIRETEAYKSVKDVIDDGASSRYGGWVEKEERRRRRELKDKNGGAAPEVFQEDPK